MTAERADDLILAELRLVRAELAAVKLELRASKKRGRKRAKSVADKALIPPRFAEHTPSELDIARVRRRMTR